MKRLDINWSGRMISTGPTIMYILPSYRKKFFKGKLPPNVKVSTKFKIPVEQSDKGALTNAKPSSR